MQDPQGALEAEDLGVLTDYMIAKPPGLGGYALHRLAEELTGGGRPMFTDCGDHLVLRTALKIDAPQRPVKAVRRGEIRAFQLRASVGVKVRGHHRYPPLSDWRSRHAWLERKGRGHGFELVALHCTATMARIDKDGQAFTIDQTDFTGVLKVTDEVLLSRALGAGVGSTGRAFGFGMLHL